MGRGRESSGTDSSASFGWGLAFRAERQGLLFLQSNSERRSFGSVTHKSTTSFPFLAPSLPEIISAVFLSSRAT